MGRKDRIKPDVVAAELDKLRGKQVDGKVNLGDATYIKRALDEAAAKVLEEQGYKEDTTLTNTRIGIGLFTCGLAALAQFYPKKYPDSYWVLLFCVTFYILATLVQNAIFGRIGGDVFFQAHLKDNSVLCLLSKMARYSEDYELSIGKRGDVWSPKQKAPFQAETKVTDYFDTEGTLLEERFKSFVLILLKRFETSQKSKS